MAAARLAEDGFEATRLYCKQLAWTAHLLGRDQHTKRMFLCEGRPPRIGRRVKFPELAATLHALAIDGVSAFYYGRIGQAIAADMRERRGLLDERDLAEFSGPRERDPLVASRGPHLVWTAPSPAGGETLLRALHVSALLRNTVRDRHERRARATCGAFADREISQRDHADMVSGGPVVIGAAEGPGETTHLCVADEEGNVVALTQSIQSLFGALHSEGTPGQLAAGIALGSILGLTPLVNIHNAIVFAAIVLLNVSFAGGMLGWALFVPIGFLLDPVFDWIGHTLLFTPGLTPVWTSLYNAPVVPLTNFNNTVVLGSLVTALVLFVPLFFAARWGIARYRATVGERIRRSALYRAVTASKLYNAYRLFRPES